MLINSFKNLKIGKNNVISSLATIHDNVTIGNNNKIYDNVVICPNTVIGDNNIIYNGNIIGEIPVQANGTFQDYDFTKTKGVIIGNNNFFHIKNIIFAGTERPTTINNNNKFLAENHMGHDSIVNNNVTFYPRVIMGGYSEYLDFSNIGGYAFIQQRKIVGQYSMIGGSQLVVKNVFPYYVYINNKITRLNMIKIPEYVKENETIVEKIANNYYNKLDINFDNYPIEIINDLKIFFNSTNVN
jgi:acyl-[acyl carrier protein]--UDP-N-acetylglucosamine O-acyltransferase